MKKYSLEHHWQRWFKGRKYYPWCGQLELTYRCNLDCVHCYCKGIGDEKEELTTRQWFKIIDEIKKEGCLSVTFTGGEALVRKDFWEIYAYTKSQGFLVTLFTNGIGLAPKSIEILKKSPPYSIEVTLNGVSEEVYESITRVAGSFKQAMGVVRELAEQGLFLIIKTNVLRQNKDEIIKIKKFAEDLLGKPPPNKYRFKYDILISPRLDGDTAPCRFRLSPQEIAKLRRQDHEISEEFQKGIEEHEPRVPREKEYLYCCNSWMTGFIVNPFGRLKFCEFSTKFGVDLKETSFREGFYGFSKLLEDKFKTRSKCFDCELRGFCYRCPARALLETGDEEAPVDYYCHLAQGLAQESGRDVKISC